MEVRGLKDFARRCETCPEHLRDFKDRDVLRELQ